MKLLTSLVLISVFLPPVTWAGAENCLLSDGINVQSKKRIIYICEKGTTGKEYKISLGRNGIGKKDDGDKKTPLGLYELGSPRKSNRFGIFIPVQYPNSEQLSAGYAGKDVGIHGPFRLFSWLGSLNTILNWTQGCIAVGKNDQIEFIANWVKSHSQSKILIN